MVNGKPIDIVFSSFRVRSVWILPLGNRQLFRRVSPRFVSSPALLDVTTM